MKTIRKIFLLLPVLLAAAVSCDKKETETDGVLAVFSAEIDDGELTKAYVTGATGVISWENGDQITVSNGVENKVFVYDATTGKFAGDRFVDATGSGFVMIYPSAVFTSASYSGGTFTVNVNLPAAQTFKDHASCSKLPMMANCPPISAGGQNSVTVRFKSICGVLGFPVTGDLDKGNFASVSFTGAGACGAGTLTCAKGVGNSLAPNLTMTDASTSRTITLSDTGTTSESTAVRYYMYLPPKTYANPKVTVNFASGSVSEVSRTKESLTVMCNYITCAELYFQTLFSGGGELGSATGTAAHPYLIKTENDLRELAAKVNGTAASYIAPAAAGTTYSTSGKYYKLVNDITLTSGFTPIGTDANPFQGVFVGNSKTISGLSVTGASACRGLFGVLSGATVSNLTISGPSVTGGTNFIGALAGKALSTAISSVTVSGGTVSGTGNTIGGLVGLLNGGSITSCSTTCAVSGASYVGGVIGSAAAGNISSCTRSSGTVAASAQHVGGIIGSLCGLDGDGNTSYSASTASISGCNSSCAVSCSRSDNGNAYVGGVIGSTNGGNVTNCKSTGGTVTASGGCIVGGVIGELNGGATMQGTSDGSRGSNAATVSGYNYVGGVCGKVWNGTLKWYNNSGGTVTGNSYVGGITGGTGAGGSCTVTYCTNSRAVTALSNLGGVAGGFGSSTASTGGINNCSNSGAVTTTNTDATVTINLGGCVGLAQANGNIDACSNSYAISTKGRVVGGIVGRVSGPTDIINCTHTKNVVSTGYYVGGIVGEVYYESGGAGIRACYATGITVQSTSDITGECGGIAGLYYSPTNTSGDVTNVIYHCQAKNCTIQATTARGSSGWATSRLGGIVGELDNSSRIIQCASKQNKVYGRTGCGGIAGMVQTKVSLGEGHVLIRGCLSQSNWLYGTVTNEDNDLGGIVGLITQEANSDEKKRYVRISECISNANCYEAKSSSDNWEATSGGIAGKISGDGANVAIRNSFSDHHATVSGNPKGAGVRCFYLSRTKANGKAAAGGFVGYFSSGTTGILRIYNSGSHITYGAWYMGGNVSTAEYLNYDQYTNTSGYDWRTLGINPMIGRVYRGQVNLNVVFWSTLAAPFTYNQWHSSSSIKDVRADDSTDTFEYKSDGAEYLTSTCINNDFTVKVVYHYADGTTKTYNFAHTYYWKPFSTDGHAPTRVKWGTANYQAVTMLNGTTGYARDNTVVNEGMGYDGHNWIHTDGRLVNNNRWYPAIGWYGN